MSDFKLENINPTTNNSGTITLFDKMGRPHVYWLHIYHGLGISAAHANKIIKKLTPETHYIKLSRDEFKAVLLGINDPLILSIPAVSSYYFINDEGWNRAIVEIETELMHNKDAAKDIEETKNLMASVFTRYQHGEVLSLAADQHKKLPGEVVQPVNEIALAEAKLRYYNTAKKIAISMGADRRSSNIVMIEKIKEEFPDIHPFMAMIPDEKVCNSPDDAVLTRQEVSDILKTDVHILEERIVKAGWVTKTIYGWLPTPRGTKYLKPDPHAGEKKTWYDIRFSLEAIRLLKEEFEQRLITGGCLSSGCSRSILPVTGNERSKNRRLGV